MQVENTSPAILCFGGLDPSGGAGLQADIEAVASCGGHAMPVATCLTVQDTVQAYSFTPIEGRLLRQQAESLLQDISIGGCKIGVIPNSDVAAAVAVIIEQLPNIPVVLDPVLRASRGSKFCDQKTIRAIKEQLLPLTSCVTPNVDELLMLIAEDESLAARASALCELGPEFVLLTDADNSTAQVCNKLFSSQGMLKEYDWPKLPHIYHGSGCTLSSALTYYLSVGVEISHAAQCAQEYTWQSLKAARVIGKGQRIPKRVGTMTD